MNNHHLHDNSLPQPAKRLILWVSGIASITLASAVLDWRGSDALALAAWIAAAALAGTIKVRFPAVESSYSFGYVVVLAAISMLRFPETILICLSTALVQCYWHVRKRPMPAQVLFNLCNYAISTAAAWSAFHGLGSLAPDLGMPARFTFGAGVFFIANTGLVSWILGILTGRGFVDVWENSHLQIFPYYLVGAACAAALAWRNDTSTPATLLAVVPLLGLLYWSMRVWVRKAGA
ncbi:MAG: hypothetical protein ABSB35_21855 [Bryobacteraceae bacterium]|jgi:hypothetical protein